MAHPGSLSAGTPPGGYPLLVTLVLPWLLACTSNAEPADTDEPSPALAWSGPRPTNVVLVSIDTFRIDHLARYGGADDMPTLSALLDASLVLDQHRSCSDWTFSSLICLLSGRTGLDWGFDPLGADPDNPEPLREDITLLADHLGERGYTTGLLATNPFMAAHFGLGRGHDRLDRHTDAIAETVVDEGLELLAWLNQQGSPWYLQLHFMDPHLSYDPPEAYLDELAGLEELDRDLTQPGVIDELLETWDTLDAEQQALILAHLSVRYRGELRYLDDQLAELLDALESRGQLDEVLLVVATDHGEQLFDRGQLGHGFTLHPEEARSVLAFHHPALQAGAWDEPTTHVDFVPTLFDTLRLEPLGETAGSVVGTAEPDRPLLAWRMGGDETLQDVQVGELRLQFQWDGERRLYDLGPDPTEQVDLYDADDPRVAELWAPLEEAVQQLSAAYPAWVVTETGP